MILSPRALLALLALALPVAAQASGHPDVSNGYDHLVWHSEMVCLALSQGNLAAAFDILMEQSTCAGTSWMTMVYTKLGMSILLALVAVSIGYSVRAFLRKLVHHRPVLALG